MLLTVGGVSNSSPGLLTEPICVGISGTIAEAGRRFGGGSSTGGCSSQLVRTILSGKLLESMKKYKEMLWQWQGFSYYLVSAFVVATVWWRSELEPGSINDDTDDRDGRRREDIFPLKD